MCKGDLTLEVSEEDEREIITGKLCCKACGQCYPIEKTIPDLRPPDMRE
jgi:uncharacterized protein YbaR (Trm112 family)